MDDDFNVPVALSVLFELAHECQRLRGKEEGAALGALLKSLGNVLGLLQMQPEDFFKAGASTLDVEKIESLIVERNAARDRKDWQAADRIRNTLKTMGILIEDNQNRTTWKRS